MYSRNKKSISKKSVIVAIKLILALALVISLSNIPNEFISDRLNYLNYLLYADSRIDRNIQQGVLPFLANEPLWLFINSNLFKLTGLVEAETVLKLIPFFITFVLSSYLLNARSDILIPLFVLLVFFFLSPFGMGIAQASLRQSLATCFLIFFVSLRKDINNKHIVLLLFLLGFIHSFYFIFTLVFIVIFSFKKIKGLSKSLQLIILILFSIFFVIIALKYSGLASYARQGVLIEKELSHSGYLFFVYAIILLITLKSYNQLFYKLDDLSRQAVKLAITGLSAYLVLYWTLPGTGRVLSTTLPFLIFYLVRNLNTYTFIALLIIFLSSLPSFYDTPYVASTLLTYKDFYSYLLFLK